jgi:hypothetical protein
MEGVAGIRSENVRNVLLRRGHKGKVFRILTDAGVVE